MEKTSESISRTVLKTISWRLLILFIDFVIAYFFTKDFDLSSKLALVKMIVASVFYFFHERAWARFNFGKH